MEKEKTINRNQIHGYNENKRYKEKSNRRDQTISSGLQYSKVILFGSRARGDDHERSDIDLAVLGGDTNNFALAVDEETSTLLMYDIEI